MQSPTYLEFRTWALTQGYTPETLAEHIDTVNPLKTAEGVLFGLPTHWDNEPLYHPTLCALYHGASAPQQQEPPAPYPHVTVANLSHVAPTQRPWLAMWEVGWSIEKIAEAWNETPAVVEAALDIASQQPLPLPRSLPPLPENEAKCTEWRQHLRELAAHGWPQESLDRITGGIYSPEFLAEMTGQEKAHRKSRSKLDPSRRCPCPCKRLLKGRQMYATNACRKKVARKRERSFV